jgi:serine/threonine protein kinase
MYKHQVKDREIEKELMFSNEYRSTFETEVIATSPEEFMLVRTKNPPMTRYKDNEECAVEQGDFTVGHEFWFYYKPENCSWHSNNVPTQYLHVADSLWKDHWQQMDMIGPRLKYTRSPQKLLDTDDFDVNIPDGQSPDLPLVGDFQNFDEKTFYHLLQLISARMGEDIEDYYKKIVLPGPTMKMVKDFLMGTHVNRKFIEDEEYRKKVLLAIGYFSEHVLGQLGLKITTNSWTSYTGDTVQVSRHAGDKMHFQRRETLGMFRYAMAVLKNEGDKCLLGMDEMDEPIERMDEPIEQGQLKFAEICRIINRINTDEDFVTKYYKSMFSEATLVPSTDSRSRYKTKFFPNAEDVILFEMNSGDDLFLFNLEKFDGGVSGTIMKSYFGSGEDSMQKSVVKVNMGEDGPNKDPRNDVMEVLMQALLFCETRSLEFGNFMQSHGYQYARIPKVLFGARMTIQTDTFNYIGMEALDITLFEFLDKLNNTPNKQMEAFISILIKICTTLEYMQSKFQFVHADLHTKNIMMKGSQPYIIDFGRASAMISGKYYNSHDDNKFTPTRSLDLIILLTTIYQLFSIRQPPPPMTELCKKLVYEPFWDKILSEDRRIVSRLTNAQKNVRFNLKLNNPLLIWHSLIMTLYSEDVQGITPLEIRAKLQHMIR